MPCQISSNLDIGFLDESGEGYCTSYLLYGKCEGELCTTQIKEIQKHTVHSPMIRRKNNTTANLQQIKPQVKKSTINQEYYERDRKIQLQEIPRGNQ